MSDALRYELVRLRTVRSTYWLVALAVLLPTVLAGLIGWATRNEPYDPALAAGLVTGGVALLPLLPLPATLMAILGVLSIGHEYRHGTIQPTLAALPRRSALVVAKLVTVGLVSALTAAAAVLLSAGVLSVVYGEVVELDGAGRAAVVGFVVLLVLWGVLGVAATLLLRNTAIVLPLLFVLPLVVEPLLSALTFIPALEDLQPATRFLPFTAGTQLAQPFSATDPELQGGTLGEPLSRIANGAVFSAFVVLVLAPAWLLFERRDA